jgi:hypothetical protein
MTTAISKKRKSTVLPRSTVDYLKNWMMSPEHIAHPYPTEKEKADIMAATGIELKQLTNWFVNNRKRFWKPRVEARLQQQLQAQKAATMTGHSQERIGRTEYRPQQVRNAISYHSVVQDSSRQKSFQTPQPSFQIITNHHTFAPPLSDKSEHSNSQVVSMGSASYSSDSDTNSLSEDHDQSFSSNTHVLSVSPSKRRQAILGQVIAKTLDEVDRKVVTPFRDVLSTPKGMKRSRSKSELAKASYSSPRNIIVRPRSLTFIAGSDTGNGNKRRCVRDFSSACRNARHSYDHHFLPSMEEAAELFGLAGSGQKD